MDFLILALGAVIIPNVLGQSAPIDLMAKFRFYFNTGCQNQTEFDLCDISGILNHTGYDKLNKKTVVYVHGYFESPDTKSGAVMTEAFCSKSEEFNILILDYSQAVSIDYITAIFNALTIAKRFGQCFGEVCDKAGYEHINTWHFIGHSLGGQTCGQIGRSVIEASSGKCILSSLQSYSLKINFNIFNTNSIYVRISALDAAGPGFSLYIKNVPLPFRNLSKSDAAFVDVMHTDIQAFLHPTSDGYPCSTGHIDFWPNGGRRLQPGCGKTQVILDNCCNSLAGPLDESCLCSHRCSFKLYAESVRRKDEANVFLSVAATDWSSFMLNQTNRSDTEQMGYSCNRNAKGDYYLQTNDCSSDEYDDNLSRGTKGIEFDETAVYSACWNYSINGFCVLPSLFSSKPSVLSLK